MKFSERKHRQPPTIIIISLIDILIVLLIFLMVTTTFKQQPALKLVLPESQQAKQSGPENGKSLLVTIATQEPFFYLGRQQITPEKLEEELRLNVLNDPEISVFLQPDTGAPFGQVLKVWDAVKLAGIKQGKIHVLTKPPGKL